VARQAKRVLEAQYQKPTAADTNMFQTMKTIWLQ
jgi:hypothetical protein